MVFTGDALFAGSVGGTAPALARQQPGHPAHIFSLPEDTEIHTGRPVLDRGHREPLQPFFV